MDTTTAPGSASLMKPLLTFAVAFLFGQILLAILGFFIEIPGSLGMILIVVAAMAAGGTFANSAQRKMTMGEKLRFALIAVLIAVAIAVGLFWAMLAYGGVPFTPENIMALLGARPSEVGEFWDIMMIVIPIVLLINVIILYFSVGFGVNSALKRAQTLAAKGK